MVNTLSKKKRCLNIEVSSDEFDEEDSDEKDSEEENSNKENYIEE